MNASKVFKIARRFVRFSAATLFWLNALLILQLPPFTSIQLASLTGLTTFESILVAFLLSVTVLNAYGFGKFVLDLLYIYGFPFVLSFHALRLLARIGKSSAKVITQMVPCPKRDLDWREVLGFLPSAQVDVNAEIRDAATPQAVLAGSNENPDNKADAPPKTALARLWIYASFPFVQFTTAWCLLLAASDKPIIVIASLGVLSMHLLRFLAMVGRFAFALNKLASGLEQRITDFTRKQVEIILKRPAEPTLTDEMRKAIAIITAVRIALFVFTFRAEIAAATMLVTFIGYFFAYTRMCLMFAFIYVGIAKLTHTAVAVPEVIVNALLMPISFTDLPKPVPFRVIGLVQSTLCLLVGLSALQAYMKRNIDALRSTAERLWDELNTDQIRIHIDGFLRPKREDRKADGARAAGS